ncbi:MAG: high frequency lysogenization protein HflD [Aquimonas sp.]|nr:high frequency lysogenization protein HflD [Aquimonas sp.]
MRDRAIALAGLLQALTAVRRIAHDGEAPIELLKPCIDSVFAIDAPDAPAIYGDAASLAPGLRCLLQQAEGPGLDPAISRMAVTVLQIERRLVRDPDMLQRLQRELRTIERQRDHFGSEHATVIERLAQLYADTISQLKPRVMVQGNPVQLSQPRVVAQIRATLLAAVRAAVLWRQSGGSYWDFALRRRALSGAARALLEPTS